MKKIITFILVIFLSTTCFASIRVPFRCHEKLLIEYFEEEGINLDKEDYNSDGFIENCGRYYKIHFYKGPDNYQEFLDIHMKVERRIQNAYRNET